MCGRGHARVLGLGIQIAGMDGGRGVRGRRGAGQGAKLDARGRAGGGGRLLDVDRGLAGVLAGAVGAAHDGGHGGDGRLDGAAVHGRHR